MNPDTKLKLIAYIFIAVGVYFASQTFKHTPHLGGVVLEVNIAYPFLSDISLNAKLATKWKFITCIMPFTNKPACFIITLNPGSCCKFSAVECILQWFLSPAPHIVIGIIKTDKERRKLPGQILHEKKGNKIQHI